MGRYQTDTKMALTRTLIQMELADGNPEFAAPLNEYMALLENGHPHVGGGNGPEVAASADGQARRPRTVRDVGVEDTGISDGPTRYAFPAGTAGRGRETSKDLKPMTGDGHGWENPHEISNGSAAIPLAQDSPGPETHSVIVRHERDPGGVLRPVYAEHPVGGCANCRKGRVRA